ncbi:DEAD/DEAH box helicase domain protein [Pyrolobus fumarii 1A]|uniref:DEAD/DEAH box helicase domain protein n=1 Tax=Pyrolobus fumarii (strain DSM 11204 / 1A) TaxID=694429 RepID=G0EEL3_PYRF1|nr:DEAD/DEAH box helicase [Pyrolobus fumarii]AEM38835.1 DEAD/DEAH box helicase domain protein [Pyrolobus fumarii 1A]
MPSPIEMLNEKIRKLLEEKGWTKLTEIQEKAIPEIMAGKNVIITAPTGYGKTEAALLPILSMMSSSNVEPVALLYITPMRALINDLYLRISWWAERLGFRVARKHGDVSQSERSKRLRKAPHILITTPESLEIDLDWATRFREYYRNLRWVIVDEVHEIVGTKRGVQLALLLSRLRRYAGDFQLVLISATVGDPMKVLEVFSYGSKRERSVVSVARRKKIEIVIDVIGNDRNYWRRAAEKIAKYLEPITLVFTNSKYASERLHEELVKLGVKDVLVHHASLSPEEREEAEKALREGKVTAVICTKTLELGIDVGDVKKVILFRPPSTVFSLVQRLGRSGHRHDIEVLNGVIIANDAVEALYAAALTKAAVEGRVEEPRIPEKPLDVLVKELVGMALQGEVNIDEAYEIFKSTYHYRNLTREELDEVVKLLIDNGILQESGPGRVKVGQLFYKIWRFEKTSDRRAWWMKSFSSFFSTIGEKSTYSVRTEDGRIVGELDASYVYKLYPGAAIRLGGRTWVIVAIDELAAKIIVREEKATTAIVPVWRGLGPEASHTALEALDKVLKEVYERGIDAITWVKLSEDARREVEKFIEEYRVSKKPLPSRDRVIIEQVGDELIILGLMGEAAARTLGYALLYAARSYTSSIRTSYYGLSIRITPGFNPLEVLSQIKPDDIENLALEAIMKTPYYLNTLRDIRLAFGQISKMGPEDNLVKLEAARQALQEFFDVTEAKRILKLVHEGHVSTHTAGAASPLARLLISMPEEKLWKVDIEKELAEALKGMAFTVEELASMTGLPEKIVEAKLREMRKPGSPYRVFQFIDVDTGDWRWALEEDVEEIVGLEEFRDSFKPLKLNEHFVLMVRGVNSEDFAHVLISARDVVEKREEFLRQVPFNEIYELKVLPITDDSKAGIPRYYYVSRRTLPYVVLNAIAVIQRIRSLDYY